LDSVELLNKQTNEYDNLLSEPIPPLGFEVLKVPLNVYGGDGGAIRMTPGPISFLALQIDDTPLALVMFGTDDPIGGTLLEGGDSFNKVLTGGLNKLPQQ